MLGALTKVEPVPFNSDSLEELQVAVCDAFFRESKKRLEYTRAHLKVIVYIAVVRVQALSACKPMDRRDYNPTVNAEVQQL